MRTRAKPVRRMEGRIFCSAGDLEVSFSEIRVTAAFGEMGNKHRGVESGGDSISPASRTSTNWHLLDREHTQNVRNLLIINYLKSWRRGEAKPRPKNLTTLSLHAYLSSVCFAARA